MSPASSRDHMLKEAFSRALEELLAQKDLSEVTTTEIINKSGLSRSTFYRYFTDKFELANWRFKILLDTLAEEHVSFDTAAGNIRDFVRYIGENRSYFKRLFSYTEQNSFHEYYTMISFEWAQRINRSAGRELTLKERFIIRYHAAGILDILNEWLMTDAPLTSDEISEIINENRSELIKMLYVDPLRNK